MPKKKAARSVKEDDSKLFAFLAVLLSIVGFIIALIAKRDNKYVMFYAKQSLVLFIAGIIAGVISWIPLIGWFILGPVLNIALLVLWIITLVYSLSGEQKETPFIGQFARKINL